MRDVVIGGIGAPVGGIGVHGGAHVHGGFVGGGLTVGRPFVMYYPGGPSATIVTSSMYQPFFNPYLPYGYGYPPFMGYY
ncbi:hypothetical protein [Metabacillus fastidiosus]|uniref:hypothetical protein n=1 Tax=Metabacillus fastidiosus TaxID=1458 RepID=UPI003D2E089A